MSLLEPFQIAAVPNRSQVFQGQLAQLPQVLAHFVDGGDRGVVPAADLVDHVEQSNLAPLQFWWFQFRVGLIGSNFRGFLSWSFDFSVSRWIDVTVNELIQLVDFTLTVGAAIPVETAIVSV